MPPLDSSLKAAFTFISVSYMKGHIVTADMLTCSRFILEDLAVVVADIFNILSWGQREQPWHWIAEYVSVKSCLFPIWPGKNWFPASCTLLLTWPAHRTWSSFGQKQEKKSFGLNVFLWRVRFWISSPSLCVLARDQRSPSHYKLQNESGLSCSVCLMVILLCCTLMWRSTLIDRVIKLLD